jgi:hypothetical protein
LNGTSGKMKNSNLIYKSLFLVVPVLAALALMLSKAEPELNLGSPDHDRADVGALRAEGVTFLRHILPMIEEKCFRCHSYRVEKPKGKLRLDSPEHIMAGAGDRVVLVPGKPDSSALYELCSLDSEDEDVMPPAGKGAVMTARQLARLRIWIEDGADFEDWAGAAASKSVMAAMAGQVESKKRNRRRRSSAGPLDVSNYGKAEGNPGLDLTPRKVTALGLSRADVIKHAGAIDGILARRRTAHGAAALPVVNDEVFVRRAYLEAVGRVPSLSERNSYLNRTQEDRRLALVDELITSEGYTQGWYHFYANLLRGTSWGDTLAARSLSFSAAASCFSFTIVSMHSITRLSASFVVASGTLFRSPIPSDEMATPVSLTVWRIVSRFSRRRRSRPLPVASKEYWTPVNPLRSAN